ncbi:MAG: hypothetical protein IIB99_06010 [Planctomycetes bacterium]|nr:hypothetical protein [Planctomycetota bacterium]
MLELIEAHDGEPGVLEPQESDNGDRMIGRRVGNFTIDRLLASGGMGSVYVATQDEPRREVALKLMRPGIASRSALRRFQGRKGVRMICLSPCVGVRVAGAALCPGCCRAVDQQRRSPPEPRPRTPGSDQRT